MSLRVKARVVEWLAIVALVFGAPSAQ